MMNLTICNCNNIDNGNVSIKQNSLNIKYAINGTGKSTIAKSIIYSGSDDKKLLESLTPFKYINDKTHLPSVQGLDNIKSVLIFDENYVNKFVFQADEIVKNSFEIFIKDDNYEKHQKQIETLIFDVKELFSENKVIENLSNVLQSFIDRFKATKTGWSANGVLGKGLAKGNKIENIPDGLEVYTPFLRNENNARWLQWQISGNDYLSIASCCPFCSSDNIEAKTDIIKKVKEEYEPKYVEHLNNMLNLLSVLSEYLSPDANRHITEIKINISGISEEQRIYLVNINKEINTLNEKLKKMKSMGFQVFKDVDDIVSVLTELKIDISYLPELNSQKMQEAVNSINSAIDNLLEKAGNLKGEINQQKKLIANKIEKYKDEINSFLECAGYKYKVDIIENDEQYKLVLYHTDSDEIIHNSSKNLSYGERNAFALILFMYDALKENPDLIILDDPISSFDGNKKFSILNKLFMGGNNFNGKTVLLLSHDFSVVIDVIYNLHDKFNANCFFLENKKGVLTEKEIKSTDILSYKQIACENIKNQAGTSILTKLVYLRRLFEFEGEKNMGYQLLSNLFHKREIPNIKKDDKYSDMTAEQIDEGEKEIGKHISGFKYTEIIKLIRDQDKLFEAYNNSSVGYEKLQYYRLLNLKNPDKNEFEDTCNIKADSIFKKYVNETFHIENDYLFQINPTKYEIVPDYILDECDRYISELKDKK
ncbi:hypothetical protein [uncultured Treponema sp.]|uniref:hypothetical protein n=2 Tax=uncultured Treponema sp. TaxID=162155 RepID=UPI002601A3BD|nr:hypothetical protein [uncultured Treponema sp.]